MGNERSIWDGLTPEACACIKSILDDPGSWVGGTGSVGAWDDGILEALRLREVSRRCDAVLDASGRAFTVFDRERRIIKFNQRAAELALMGWGVVYEEGMPLNETGFIHEHLELFDAGLDLVFGGERLDIEWSGEDIRGAERHYEVSFVPLRGAAGEVESALVVGEDVTSRRQSELERVKQNTHQANAQRVDALGIMASGIAHDFNNMFMLLLTHASMIEFEVERIQENSPELVRHVVGEVAEIERTIIQAKAVTTQLLEFAGSQLAEPASILPSRALRECVLSTRGAMPVEVELVLEPSESTWRVVLDPSQLEQLLERLVLNAGDAFDGEGRITLRVLEESLARDRVLHGCVLKRGEYVVMEVEDDGCGISEHDVPRIFDPFFTTKRHGEHTRLGLGLASSFGIVRGANGAIECSSTIGHGTTFRIWLPRARVAEATGRSAPQGAPGDVGRRVLLAEDQEDLRSALERILVRYGFEVVSCADGEQVIECLKTDKDFAILLTDVVMPNLGGVEAAKAFAEVIPNAPVVFMSGYVDDMLLSQELAKGVTVVQKPCLPRELIEILERALQGVSH